MGLLDGLLGNVMGSLLGGSRAQQQSPLLQIALQLLQQHGGLEGLLGKFRQAGYAEEAQSWVSTGENRPITADVLQQVLGHGQLGDIARQLGMSDGDAAGGLASILPQVIDGMTPQGEVPRNSSDLVEQVLATLQKTRTR